MNKDKITYALAAFVVYAISVMAITYMFYGKINWVTTILFSIFMVVIDMLFLKKIREGKNKK